MEDDKISKMFSQLEQLCVEEKKGSGVFFQIEQAIKAIWRGRHYVITWGLFLSWIYFLKFIVESYFSDISILTVFVFLITVFSLIVFFAVHDKISSHIRDNSTYYYAVISSLSVIGVFFASEGTNTDANNAFFNQQILANFGTFFGGVLTPIGIFLALLSYREKKKRDEIDLQVLGVNYMFSLAIDLYGEFISVLSKNNNKEIVDGALELVTQVSDFYQKAQVVIEKIDILEANMEVQAEYRRLSSLLGIRTNILINLIEENSAKEPWAANDANK